MIDWCMSIDIQKEFISNSNPQETTKQNKNPKQNEKKMNGEIGCLISISLLLSSFSTSSGQ